MYGNILVGLSFMALTFLTVKTFAPDIKSNAETQNISETVGPYTMSISTDSLTSINITPTASQAVYTGTSAISYTNTCPHGMNVTMSSASENTSLTRTGSDSGTKEVPTISSGTALTDNTWGFSKDNGSTYNAIPALANPATIIDTTSANTTAATLNLIYGVKTDNQLPSGSYSNDIVYTVSAKQQCLSYGITWDLDGGTAATGATYPASLTFGSTLDLTSLTPTKEGYEFTGWSNGTNTFDGTETAADINPSSAPSLTMTAQWEQVVTMQTFDVSTMIPNTGDSMTLRDERDNNMYTVKRLADGKVWMTQNLRLINKTISSADSNLPEGETWTIPASSVSGFSEQNTNNAYLDSTYGGYYTFYAATAGWGTNSVTSGNSPKDICPKGWRLPTGGSSGEFQTLYNNYNSSALMRGDPAFTLSGNVRGGSVYYQGSYGYFWSSTVANANNAYRLDLNSSDVGPASYNSKYNGFSVRCVAKDTMQTFNKSTLTNVGDSVELEDARDGNIYTVKKLADGNVWMTENLRLINKTISSTDSNLPSGETYTVPASNLSSFTTTSYDTNSAYLDSTYGGYYNFYTATAGTGGTSLTSGNAPSSICPKGWRLPTGGSSGEFNTLYGQYNSAALLMGEPSFTLSGYVYNGSVRDQGAKGIFWSSTVGNANEAARMYLSSSSVYPSNINFKSCGHSVRCVAI